ncbi:hypothetical protein [Gordonia hirsuta]|nr:hypothetical protein [Gordonia hirsuta]
MPRIVVPLPGDLPALLDEQDGVITRRQILDGGGTPALVRSKLRRGEWVRKYPGVYLTHTGDPSPRQRTWLALLGGGAGAVLCDRSAVFAAGGSVDGRRYDDGAVHIAVDGHGNLRRRSARVEPVVVHYISGLAEKSLINVRPARLRPEYAVLRVAGQADTEHRAVARLAEGVGSRIVTAERMLTVLGSRHNYRRQTFLEQVLADIRDGTCSVLEHRYLTDVERGHGLPAGTRQAPTAVGRKGFRDVLYGEAGVIVELDGRFGHDDAAARDRDLERDLDALIGGIGVTARVGSGQVYDRPCQTAQKVARLLTAHGWTGTPTRCRIACTLRWPPPP